MRGVIAKIKQALPVRAAIPIYPGRKGKGAALGHVRGELHVIVRAIQDHCLRLAVMARGISRRAEDNAVVAKARGIPRIGGK